MVADRPCHTHQSLAVVESGALDDRSRRPLDVLAEDAVLTRSADLRKELSVRDLAFAQVLFIVGLQWVGVAARQGPAHVIFWLIAVALFYLVGTAFFVSAIRRAHARRMR